MTEFILKEWFQSPTTDAQQQALQERLSHYLALIAKMP